MELQEKQQKLRDILNRAGSVLVAYSGGVDSTLLTDQAIEVLGPEKVLACTALGPLLPEGEYEQALKLAQSIGVKMETIELNQLEDQRVRYNQKDRCYHCKKFLFRQLVQMAQKRGYNKVICGSNADDYKVYRPGNKAVDEVGALAPLAQAEFTKAEIRELSRHRGLPTAEKPASPCLATRLDYGVEITEKKLEQISQAERFLKELGLTILRVRHHERIARIEVPGDDIEKITSPSVRTKIAEKLKSLGFSYVTLDLQGYRSGAMDEDFTANDKES